jgi:hypothetical protein
VNGVVEYTGFAKSSLLNIIASVSIFTKKMPVMLVLPTSLPLAHAEK